MGERISIHAVQAETGMSRSTLYRRMACSILPFPAPLDGEETCLTRGKVWDRDAVQAWMSKMGVIASVWRKSEFELESISFQWIEHLQPDQWERRFLQLEKVWRWTQRLPDDWKPWIKPRSRRAASPDT